MLSNLIIIKDRINLITHYPNYLSSIDSILNISFQIYLHRLIKFFSILVNLES